MLGSYGSRLGKDRITSRKLDQMDLLHSLLISQAVQKKIDVTGRAEFLMVDLVGFSWKCCILLGQAGDS